jgi:hypothetical protein
MYAPPFEALLHHLGSSREELEKTGSVRVPAELLKFFLQMVLASCNFGEAGYLRANPDVAEAIKHGQIPNARMHFLGFGYFEGREGGMAEVDESWYLATYPDVAAAVRAKQVASAAEHFRTIGAVEGRSPNPREQATAAEWKRLLGKSAGG